MSVPPPASEFGGAAGASAEDVAALRREVAALREGQRQLIEETRALLVAVKETQAVVAHGVAAQAQYQGDTATVLDHLSATVLGIDARIPDE